MPHINEKIDYVVNAWIVNKGRVLLVFHKGAQTWLPIGGHIELNENPDQALFREIKEECGLDVEVVGGEVSPDYPTTSTKKLLITPASVDMHPMKGGHQHVALEYFARAKSDKVVLTEQEHDDIRWFTSEDIDDLRYDLLPDIKFFAREALKRVQ
jgi:8-oxo-dGTP pyrophosphatase MutT (NUDIX family)